VVALLVTPGSIQAQTTVGSRSQSDQHATVPSSRVFGSDAGMVLNFIKPDKTGDFEAIVAKLKDALQRSKRPERVQQAKSWKVFRALEPAGNGAVLYLFVIDPVVPGADYTVSTILAEAFPDDVQSLYKQYAESYATGQNFVNLNTVLILGGEPLSTK
jgi:hypothetical protein